MLNNFEIGLQTVLQPEVFLAVVIGSFAGVLIGILPGLGGATGVALLMPFTFGMSPAAGLAMLATLYSTCQYGGSITAITVNTPGDPSSAPTVFDGYKLTQKGLTGKALRVSLYSSFTGSFISLFILVTFSVPLARFALNFGPAEYFALAVFGLTIVATMVNKNWIKGLMATIFGLLLATVGVDPFTGHPRFTFGFTDMYAGIEFVPILIGLFAISEVFRSFEEGGIRRNPQADMGQQRPTFKEMKGLAPTVLRSSLIGSVIGAVPGAGATIAAFVSYNEAKRWSKKPENFGKGSLEGVSAPETANDAAVKGAMIPMLSLGIPGSATTAVLLGALMIHGLAPGPMLFTNHPDLVYGLFVSFIVANILLLVIGLSLNKLFVKAVSLPSGIVAPVVLALSLIGAYSIGNNAFNLILALVFGVIGYLFHKVDIPVAPIILGLVLGGIVESNLRRALVISDGSWMIFFSSPISFILLILTFLSLIYPFLRNSRWMKNRVKINN